MALLTRMLQVGGIDRGQGILRWPDVVDTVTVEADCLMALRAIALLTDKVHCATVKILQIGFKDVRSNAVLGHERTVGVTVSTDLNAVISVRCVPWATNTVHPVAFDASGHVWVGFFLECRSVHTAAIG